MASRGIHESVVTESSTRMLWDTTVNPFSRRGPVFGVSLAPQRGFVRTAARFGPHLHTRRLGLDHGARAPRHLTRPAVDAWGSSARVASETITK